MIPKRTYSSFQIPFSPAGLLLCFYIWGQEQSACQSKCMNQTQCTAVLRNKWISKQKKDRFMLLLWYFSWIGYKMQCRLSVAAICSVAVNLNTIIQTKTPVTENSCSSASLWKLCHKCSRQVHRTSRMSGIGLADCVRQTQTRADARQRACWAITALQREQVMLPDT